MYFLTTPWERQPGEPDKAFRAFTIFRDLPPEDRSLRRVAERLGQKSISSSLAQRWYWRERVALWDEEQDKRRREALLRESEDAAVYHAKIARRAAQLVEKKIGYLEEDDGAVKGMSVRDMVSLMESAVKLERLSRSMSTDNVAHQHALGRNEQERNMLMALLSNPEAVTLADQLSQKMLAANLDDTADEEDIIDATGTPVDLLDASESGGAPEPGEVATGAAP